MRVSHEAALHQKQRAAKHVRIENGGQRLSACGAVFKGVSVGF
jgi:hypothetical protein